MAQIDLVYPSALTDNDWSAIEAERDEVAKRCPDTPKLGDIQALLENGLASLYQVVVNGKRVGSMALRYDMEEDKLFMLWLFLQRGNMNEGTLQPIRQTVKAACNVFGQPGIVIPGRLGWARYFAGMKAKELSRVWFIEAEQM